MTEIPKAACLPDYENCGVSIAAAVLRYFGVPCAHAAQRDMARLLKQKQYKNIVVMLFDGVGSHTLTQALDEGSFLRQCERHDLSAVFPPTTVAATTSIEGGETPQEHAWLGWSQYIAAIDRLVDVFLDRDSLTHEKLGEDKSVARRYMPYRTVCEKLNDTGRVTAHVVSPYGTDRVDTLAGLFDRALSLCLAPGRRYIYTYWPEPDHTMHDAGVDGAKAVLPDISRRVEAFCRETKEDTLVVFTADHGLIDCQQLYMEDHPALADMCIRPFSLEARDAAFFVREDCLQAFPQAFEEAFGGKGFWLLKSEEAAALGLFGKGKEHPAFRAAIGDYLAVATGEYALAWEYDAHPMIGMHAGISDREMRVPLIVCKK